MAISFVASTAAGSAYLTVSEIFPLETRAMAIALFHALGTLLGGVSAPFLFGYLIGSGSEWAVAGGYLGAAALMIGGSVCEAFLGVEAAGKSLEDVAAALSGSGCLVSVLRVPRLVRIDGFAKPLCISFPGRRYRFNGHDLGRSTRSLYCCAASFLDGPASHSRVASWSSETGHSFDDASPPYP